MSENNPRCMGCMNPISEGRERCGFCGYPTASDNPSLYLPVHTMLSETYEVGNMINFRGDTASYIGYDHSQSLTIIIREFFPEQLCTRKANGSLAPHMGFEPVFADYFGKFRTLARSLAKVRGLGGIMSIYDIFEENQTVYTIAESQGMVTLKSRVEKEGYLHWDEVRPLFVPLLTSLTTLHAAGITHLGISPDNILIGTDGKLCLQAFSIEEARRAGTKIQPYLPSGFAAPEQYSTSAEVGAWSDVYAMSATILYTLTGVAPLNATKRDPSGSDLSIPSKIAGDIPQNVALTLLQGLQLDINKRTRSIALFRDDLTIPPAVRAMQDDGIKEEQAYFEKEKTAATAPTLKRESLKAEPAKKKSANGLLIVLGVGTLISFITIIILILTYKGPKDINNSNSNSADLSTTQNTTSVTSSPGATFSVPNIVGENYFTLDKKTLLNDMFVELGGLVFSDKPYGEIVSQAPTVEENAPAGSAIVVYISAGKDTIKVPNVTGMHYTDAEEILLELGFKVDLAEMEQSSGYAAEEIGNVEGLGTSLPRGSTIKIYMCVKSDLVE